MTYVEKAEKEITNLNSICDKILEYQENLNSNKDLPDQIYGATGVYSANVLETLYFNASEVIEIIEALKKDLMNKAIELDEQEKLNSQKIEQSNNIIEQKRSFEELMDELRQRNKGENNESLR